MSAATYLIIVDHLGRPTTSNMAHKWHHRAVSADRKQWRSAGRTHAERAHIPHLSAAHLTVQGVYRARPMPDTDAISPAVKGVIDGLVDANVLAGDTGVFVRSVTYLAPRLYRDDDRFTGKAALFMHIEEAPA